MARYRNFKTAGKGNLSSKTEKAESVRYSVSAVVSASGERDVIAAGVSLERALFRVHECIEREIAFLLLMTDKNERDALGRELNDISWSCQQQCVKEQAAGERGGLYMVIGRSWLYVEREM